MRCGSKSSTLRPSSRHLRPKILILCGLHPEDLHGLPESSSRNASIAAEACGDEVDGSHDFVVQLAVDLGQTCPNEEGPALGSARKRLIHRSL